jgi:hypothetical protein
MSHPSRKHFLAYECNLIASDFLARKLRVEMVRHVGRRTDPSDAALSGVIIAAMLIDRSCRG